MDDGSENADFCSQYAKPGMMNVIRKRCTHQGCSKQPTYGVDNGRKKAEFCTQHATNGHAKQ